MIEASSWAADEHEYAAHRRKSLALLETRSILDKQRNRPHGCIAFAQTLRRRLLEVADALTYDEGRIRSARYRLRRALLLAARYPAK